MCKQITNNKNALYVHKNKKEKKCCYTQQLKKTNQNNRKLQTVEFQVKKMQA
jgi:hypothetical protein